MYILSTGCQWRAIPKDLPPRSTLFDYFDLWTYDGTLDRIHHALYVACREQAEREASPTAATRTDDNGRAQALPASEESCPRSMPALRNARSYFKSNAESKMSEGSAGQLSQPFCCISASS